MVSARDAVDTLMDATTDGRIDALCERLGVRLLGIFGSAAPNAPWADHEPHDVDIAVSFSGTPRLVELVDALIDLTGYDSIDVAVTDGANPALRGDAFVGVGLYEAEPGLYAEEQIAALAVKRDTEWLRRLDLDALAG